MMIGQKIKLFIKEVAVGLGIVCVHETWLKPNLDLIHESIVKRRPELHSLVKR